MKKSINNVRPLNPEVLLRVMLYNDPTRRSATRFVPDAWVDFDTAFGPTFRAGTEHQVALVHGNRKSAPFTVIVERTPILEQGPHPSDSGKTIPMATVYLMPAA